MNPTLACARTLPVWPTKSSLVCIRKFDPCISSKYLIGMFSHEDQLLIFDSCKRLSCRGGGNIFVVSRNMAVIVLGCQCCPVTIVSYSHVCLSSPPCFILCIVVGSTLRFFTELAYSSMLRILRRISRTTSPIFDTSTCR